MSSLLKILTVISALATAGYSLSCISCNIANAASCTGSSFTCPSGFICASVIERLAGEQSYDFTRKCVEQKSCNLVGSFSMNSFSRNIAVTCCNTNNCLPKPPKLIIPSAQINGKECPGCMSINTAVCDKLPIEQCRGDATRCVTMTLGGNPQQQQSDTYYYHGCASQSLCDLRVYNFSSPDSTMSFNFACSGANI